MQLTLSEILKNENNGKRFINIHNGSIVKNVDGSLLFAKMIECIAGPKKLNVVYAKGTGRIQWEKATKSSFWVNGIYEEID